MKGTKMSNSGADRRLMGASGRIMVRAALAATVLAVGAVGWLGRLHAEPAADAPTTDAATTKLVDPLMYFRVDRARRRIIIGAEVAVREGALEFVLSGGAKSHETLLVTRVKPSLLHAGLLALGLEPGKPGEWTQPPGKEPAFVPPRGALLDIKVRWDDAKGKGREAAVTDWMVVAGTKRKTPPTRWVFVGSDFLDDGQYAADAEGHHVSVANFVISVIDVPFESTAKDALREFAANPAAMPPAGTKAKLVITAMKGATTAPVARMSFKVDRFGRITRGAKALTPEQVGPVVRAFLSRHSQGTADVRIDPRALIYDREVVAGILRRAGMTDVRFRMTRVNGEILPRTTSETKQALKWWRDEFAQGKDRLFDPAKDAAAAIANIAAQRKRLGELSELWGEYAAGLAELVKDYHAKNKPEDDGPEREGR